MAPTSADSSSDLFKCVPLCDATENDIWQIDQFMPVNENGSGLVAYLQVLAFPDEANGRMRTYLVKDCQTDELVGYFSLKAGLISYNEEPEDASSSFDTLPGVELANYAMNAAYREAHPDAVGCGLIVFQRLILPMVQAAASLIGICRLYLFALPDDKVTATYEGYGFSRLPREEEDLLHQRLKPRYDDQCIFMSMTL